MDTTQYCEACERLAKGIIADPMPHTCGLEPENETMAGFREGFAQALAGEVHPISELWDGVDHTEEYLRAALSQSSQDWRMPEWVPAKVRLLVSVRSDIPGCGLLCRAPRGSIHYCASNKWGAVTIQMDDCKLGLRPHEFTVLEWVRNPYVEEAR